jgi:hypothetical protein
MCAQTQTCRRRLVSVDDIGRKAFATCRIVDACCGKMYECAWMAALVFFGLQAPKRRNTIASAHPNSIGLVQACV